MEVILGQGDTTGVKALAKPRALKVVSLQVHFSVETLLGTALGGGRKVQQKEWPCMLPAEHSSLRTHHPRD